MIVKVVAGIAASEKARALEGNFEL